MNNNKDKFNRPPKIASHIISHMIDPCVRVQAMGDLEEQYNFNYNNLGKFKARMSFYYQMMMMIPIYLPALFIRNFAMFNNYFKTFIRDIKCNKLYSFVNISGLTIGLVSCILIMLWVQDEFSFDKFHQNADNIFRILGAGKDEPDYFGAVTPSALAKTLKDELPEVKNASRLSFPQRGLFKYGNNSYYVDKLFRADAEIFQIFSFKFLKGSENSPFSDIRSIVITKEIADKFFGDEDPIGKVLLWDNVLDLTVSAVIEDIQKNSHLNMKIIYPFDLYKEFGEDTESWDDASYYTYLHLNERTNITNFNKEINISVDRHFPNATNNYFLQPLKDFHFSKHLLYDNAGKGNITYVSILSFSALFILLIACINFINLSTARSGSRAKEIGLRKVFGANRSELISQFFQEGIILTLFTFALALIIVNLVLPEFNISAGKELTLNFLENSTILFELCALVILTGILSGLYPALFLSAFNPVKTLKSAKLQGGNSMFRKIMVISQFSLLIILIIGTTIVFEQIEYMRNRNLGFKSTQIIHFQASRGITKNFEAAKNELLKNPAIEYITAIDALPNMLGSGTNNAKWEGKEVDKDIQMQNRIVDYDYLKIFNHEILEGRFFSKEFPTDGQSGFVLNETAVKAMDLSNPIGKNFEWNEKKGTIIGVVEDFHFVSMHTKIAPLFLTMLPRYQMSTVCLKISSSNTTETIKYISSVFKEFSPEYPFEYNFLDDTINEMYANENKLGSILNIFTTLALYIACSGLFGLSSFIAEKRTKEIGIRKVLGSSVSSILIMLAKDMTKWTVLANIFAWPVAYYVMNNWLDNFTYRTSLSLTTFLIAGAVTLFISLITVSYQVIKAANRNPIYSLKHE